MKRATRDFMQARQKHCSRVLTVENVNRIGGKDANTCFQNATDELKSKQSKIVSGWIVCPYIKELDSTEIIQHWWNFDGKQHYDTTELPSVDYDYIMDSDIGDYGQEHYDHLKSMVCSSILLKSGNFFGVHKTDEGTLQYRALTSLSSATLFAAEMLMSSSNETSQVSAGQTSHVVNLAALNGMNDSEADELQAKIKSITPNDLKDMFEKIKKS